MEPAQGEGADEYEGELYLSPPDWKPAARVVDKAARADYVNAHNACEICGRYGRLTCHHLLKRSQGGDDVPENFAALCGHGTIGCHGDAERAVSDPRGRAARMALRVLIERHPKKRAYLAAQKSEGWLDRMYPDRYRAIKRNGQTSL